MKRKPIRKHKVKEVFNRSVHRTKMVNLAPPPMRGGYRL